MHDRYNGKGKTFLISKNFTDNLWHYGTPLLDIAILFGQVPDIQLDSTYYLWYKKVVRIMTVTIIKTQTGCTIVLTAERFIPVYVFNSLKYNGVQKSTQECVEEHSLRPIR